VVRGDTPLSQARGELVCGAFHQPPGIDENQRTAVLLGQRCNAVVHLTPHLMRGDGSQLLIGDVDLQLHGPAVSQIDDGALGGTV
jgi:hypothetical protein